MKEINIPEHWEILPFTGCLKKVKFKKKPSIPKKDYQESGEFPVIDQGASFIAGWTDSSKSVISDYLPLVIFGDHTRIFKYVDFPFALGADGTKLLHVNDDILDPRFFYYALSNLNVPNKGYNRHYRYLQEFSMVCPPLPEQRAIAHILHTIQEAKFTRQREIALERERKAALMDFLFTHGTKREPRKQTEIGEIPESWEVVRLGGLVKLKSGMSRPKDIKNKPDSDRTIPVYGGNGILGYTSKKFSDQRLLVIGRVGAYCGCVHVAEAPNWITDNALYTEKWLNSEVSLDFLAEQLRYFNLNRFQRRGGQPLITQSILHQLNIPLPPLPEQRTIANIFRAIDTKTAALEREVELIDELFHAMLDELMTGQRSAVPLMDVMK